MRVLALPKPASNLLVSGLQAHLEKGVFRFFEESDTTLSKVVNHSISDLSEASCGVTNDVSEAFLAVVHLRRLHDSLFTGDILTFGSENTVTTTIGATTTHWILHDKELILVYRRFIASG